MRTEAMFDDLDREPAMNSTPAPELDGLLRSCCRATSLDGAGVSIVDRDGTREPLYASDEVATVIERLLTKLVEVVMAQAGADKGYVVLHHNERLVIDAEATVDDSGALGVGRAWGRASGPRVHARRGRPAQPQLLARRHLRGHGPAASR